MRGVNGLNCCIVGFRTRDLWPPPPTPRLVCYRNAAGQSWDGQGEMPDWLPRAVNAGQSVAFYRIR